MMRLRVFFRTRSQWGYWAIKTIQPSHKGDIVLLKPISEKFLFYLAVRFSIKFSGLEKVFVISEVSDTDERHATKL